MKIISVGSSYKIFQNDVKSYDKLPVQAYSVSFSPQEGFSLTLYPNIEVKEKIYGVHAKKVSKVKNAFIRSERNLGIILSGDKGIGKSLFAKMLVTGGLEDGYPVIVIEKYIPGIAAFLNSIEQEVFVLFDEFDKTFSGDINSRDNLSDPQTEMLGLFDGISASKKLFIVTCNSLNKLSDFLVNRPGRFHYHFRFNYPTPEDISLYLQDRNIPEVEIEKVKIFSGKVPLNYDCLRAIAFELSAGENFEDTIEDLNIINIEKQIFNISLFFKDNKKLQISNFGIDFFNDQDTTAMVHGINNTWVDGFLTFNPTNALYDITKGCYYIDSKNALWTTELDDDEEFSKDDEKPNIRGYEKNDFQFALIKHQGQKSLHYKVSV